MTLNELKIALRRYGFDDSDPLTTWINAAYYEFIDANEWAWHEQYTELKTISGMKTFQADGNFDQVISMKLQGINSELSYVDTRKFFREAGDFDRIGLPTIYTVLRVNEVWLWPIPDRAYTIQFYYRCNPSELREGTDTPSLPSKYHYAIVLGAAAIALAAENEEDRAQTAHDQFRTIIDNASNKRFKQTGQARSVQDTQGYSYG